VRLNAEILVPEIARAYHAIPKDMELFRVADVGWVAIKAPICGGLRYLSEDIMDKKIAGLLGAVAALTSMTVANAATPAQSASSQAASYADLLNPVPNAVAQLIADDAARAAKPSGREIEVAQINVEVGGHHHHHRSHRRHKKPHHHSNFMAVPRANV
jgi:hypothetical protein